MPMTNGESIQFAMDKCHARKVSRLTQGGPNCTAYVAMWLRKRSRNKPFVTSEYFYLDPELTEFRGQRSFEEESEGVKGKGVRKAEYWQPRMKGGGKAERTYIESGSKEKTRALKWVRDQHSTPMSTKKHWDGLGVRKLILELGEQSQLASIGMWVGVPHALGVDCSQKRAAYFDPNLGELTFSNAEWLAYWWAMCFREDRSERPSSTMPSAWKHMTDSRFTAQIYERVAD